VAQEVEALVVVQTQQEPLVLLIQAGVAVEVAMVATREETVATAAPVS